MPTSQRANIEAPPATIPAGKRLPFGWSAFAVPAAQSTLPVVLRWPEAITFTEPARLRVTVALDVRENKLVEARTAQTNELLGTFDIRFASICQPFEIVVAPEKANLTAREGVRLQMTSGENSLWLFDGKGGAPDAFAPQWIAESAGDKWAQFEARLCSTASVQAFGWIEGCVLDGLWQMARNGQLDARAAIESHLRLFVSAQGDLDYEGPGSNPLHNAIYGMEGLLPFAIIAQVAPENRVLNLAIDYCLKHHDAQGAVVDGGNTTTEGVYIAGYPLAVIGKLRGREDLMHLALMQLRSRRQRNVINGTIFQAVSADGKARLPNWARGVAWYLLGFARVLDVLNPGDEAADLYEEFKRAALWAMERQQADGLWRNFFDDPNSVSDTSGSAGIATALALGARRGWLPDAARNAAQSTLNGLEQHLTPDGFLGGMAQFNKGGEALQRANYRVMAPMAMGLAAGLRAELSAGRAAHRVLLRGSWRTENIGDVGHTPGMLQIMREHLPGVQVTLWPTDIGDGVEEMLRRNFPDLRIARSEPELKAAFDECDFLLHGSATSLAQPASVERWQRETGKPYGVYGITLAPAGDKAQALVFNPGLTESQRNLLNGARFLYLRDGASLQVAKTAGISCPIVEFGPDSAFGVKLRDEIKATAFLREHGLEDGRFLCAIGRLRNTPFWGAGRAPQSDFDKAKHAVNEEWKKADFAKVRAAITAFVRETGFKVLLCPECDDHMVLNREMILDRLPADVQARTVWREDFWHLDEAISVYARTLALLSMDMHSPIMAVANGTPAIVCRWWQQTSKGLMWRDIGLGEWLFNMDEENDGDNITKAVLSIARDPAAARAKVAAAMAIVHERQRATMTVFAHELAKTSDATR